MEHITAPTLDLARSFLAVAAMAAMAVCAFLTIVFGLSDILNNPDGHPKTRRMTGRCGRTRPARRDHGHGRGN